MEFFLFFIVIFFDKIFKNLGWQDSNLRVAESKSAALPLGDTPKFTEKNKETIKLKPGIGQEGIRTPDTVVRSHVL